MQKAAARYRRAIARLGRIAFGSGIPRLQVIGMDFVNNAYILENSAEGSRLLGRRSGDHAPGDSLTCGGRGCVSGAGTVTPTVMRRRFLRGLWGR